MPVGERCGSGVQQGFTYVWVLAAVAVVGIGLAAIGPAWVEAAKREREAELLRIGQLYAQAIASYHRSSPGSEKRYPPSLDALLLDARFVGIRRHLRRAYGDPTNAGQPFGIVRGSDATVRGVFSRSVEAPLQQEPLDLGLVVLPAARSYSEWQFVAKVD
jgi:type II secretory pathway pseudopilin PulG